MPDRSDNYQIPSWPKVAIGRDLWNAVMADIAQRISDRESLENSFEALIAQGTQASLDYIQVSIAPQLAGLQSSIEDAQELIDEIIEGGNAPNALKFGGQLPAYYATADGLNVAILELTSAFQAVSDTKANASSVYTKSQVDSAIAAGGVPIGASIAFNGTTVPTGFLKENGAAYSRTTYAALFAVIGTTHGIGDGSTTFNVPDSRGEFVRGLDDGRGVDIGRTLGSAQASQNLAHVHGVSDPGHAHVLTHNVGPSGGTFQNDIVNQSVNNNAGPVARVTSSSGTGITINSSGGTEARPRNVAKLMLIRAY